VRKDIDAAEMERLELLSAFERKGYSEGYHYIAGVDEAGRGPIAGPVAAAAVILPENYLLPGVDDSKKLTPKIRSQLVREIKRGALSWAVTFVFPPYLDRINILNATIKAMELAVRQLTPFPDLLLIDALKLPNLDVAQIPLIKGDARSMAIACASILAKEERDAAMGGFEQLYPGYGFADHKGYATRMHIQAIYTQGVCGIHRESFEPVKTIITNRRVQPGLFQDG
jgi:ribonuclease HII